MRKSIAFAAAAAFVSGGIAIAADQGAAARRLFVYSPPSGNKTIVYKSKNTTATLVGNPVTYGASFNISIGGDGTQCMTLPSSGWTAISNVGFKYTDRLLANGPVRIALLKRNASLGIFRVKLIAKRGAITVAPGDPTTSYGTNFKINGGGDSYCASNGSASPATNTATSFQVYNDDGEACSVSACSSPSGAFLEAAVAF
jgi:hypothetical protein